MTVLKDSKGRKFKGYHVAKDDYPQLEGKIIKYSPYIDLKAKRKGDRYGEYVMSGLVVGCNTSVGITIVDATDKDRYLVCFTGPVAPGGSNVKHWDQGIWEYIINAIGRGVVNNYDLLAFNPEKPTLPTLPGCPNAGMCAYNQ